MSHGGSFYKPSAMLDAMAGKRMPGGCDDCDAYQVVTEAAGGVYVLQVHHDATCPEYRRTTGQQGGAQ